MGLIDELQEEHKKLLELFADFYKKIDNPGSLGRLKNFKTLLLSHLNKEDKKLYPVLDNSKLEEISKVSKQFSGSMLKLSKVLIATFEIIEKNIDNVSSELNKEINQIGIKLKGRIVLEEYTLYPLYLKAMKEK